MKASLFSQSLRLTTPFKALELQRRGFANIRYSSSMKRFNLEKFFDENYFWKKANVGSFVLLCITFPYWFGGVKSMYWTFRYRSINRQEILSDRFAWLYERMLEDEVEKVLLKSIPAEGFKKDEPGLIIGPGTVLSQ